MDSPNGKPLPAGPLLLSCDWGTSSFRLRLVSRRTARIEAEHSTEDGAKPIAAANVSISARHRSFRAVLERGLVSLGVAHRTDIPLVISGMACSTIGWQSLGYASLPARLTGRDYVTADRRVGGRKVRFVSGLRAACDVMRGEECELTGLFAAPGRQVLAHDCLVVLPGTHSKHVRIRKGRITDFCTHPTGELFALLSKHSTFGGKSGGALSLRSFRAGIEAARRSGMGPALFRTRARTVLGCMPPEESADFLSGVLIGSEIASLPRGVPIVLAAGPALARRYSLAVRLLFPKGEVFRIAPGEMARAVVRGHLLLGSSLED
ncbi:MAG: 2-dehydro-3-deoxygalactonokinase [Opitutaceae bacterium]|nr:2-dehydro-3-deoxygalactonokinase [Opitutaceae bacterium]